MSETQRTIVVGTPHAGIATEIANLYHQLVREVITQAEFDEAKTRLLASYPAASTLRAD